MIWPKWLGGLCIWPTILLALSSCARAETFREFYERTRQSSAREEERSVLSGPNVCGPRQERHCCPGWTQPSSTVLKCNKPICKSSCKPGGTCIRPNTCLCNGDPYRGISARFAPSCELTDDAGRELQSDRACGTSCLHGGRCGGKTCDCQTGYSGPSCGTPICSGGCQNGGRCLTPSRCACNYGFSGAQCQTDHRVGPCFTTISYDRCMGALTGVKCTRALCCASIGKGWGLPCERCPIEPHPCNRGYIFIARDSNCQDINECYAIPGLCVGGTCVNTQGSYVCSCQEGQRKNQITNTCEDIDECETVEGVCQYGKCINTEGGYFCQCYPDYQLSSDQKSCIGSIRKQCFGTYESGVCGSPMGRELTLRKCCCSFGRGWGSGEGTACQSCPSTLSAAYDTLCNRDPGPGPQTGTCQLFPGICPDGICIDTLGSYRCDCRPGHMLNSKGVCEDEDECTHAGICKNGDCTNTRGSYHCTCKDGYVLAKDRSYCTDMNECEMDEPMCPNGECVNMRGGYICNCYEGYRQSPNQQVCYDVDECLENGRICQNGQCVNLPGTYRCDCRAGYELSPDKAFCFDMDECSKTGMCVNGKCLNIDGGYKCLCLLGFIDSADQTACVDFDECKGNPCVKGECINNQGSFTCVCPRGYSLREDGRTCEESRREYCFLQIVNGQCTNQGKMIVKKSQCCCSMEMMGAEGMCWGMPSELCPKKGTSEYNSLCPCAGMDNSCIGDINECHINPELCPNGQCINLKPWYRCECAAGFRNHPTNERVCININECLETPDLCKGGKCLDNSGSFACSCPPGFTLNPAINACYDVDECQKSPCVGGTCMNSPGSYSCLCPGGHIKQSNGTHIICIDNRIGYCWGSIDSNDDCMDNISPGGITKDQCCNTFGKAWGSPCARCPSEGPRTCPRGYYRHMGRECRDFDECTLNNGFCENGKCVNTPGSFTCDCDDGYTLDRAVLQCIDFRKQSCYLSYRPGLCEHPMRAITRRAECCCSVGRAWGSCDPCPAPNTAAYKSLCGGGSKPTPPDVDECSLFPELCVGGMCKNTRGSFECICGQGLTVDYRGLNCTDIDECSLNPGVCGEGECVNTFSAFECHCKSGYEAHPLMLVCMDVNECLSDPTLCRGGLCENIEGSFTCRCPEGHELSPGGTSCKDVNECSTGSAICSNGKCQNFMGGYQCSCVKGYVPNTYSTACVDVDECSVNNGGCQDICTNIQGSFVCSCNYGYRLLANGKTCVDVNECFTASICGGGHCENEDGTYRCICPRGWTTAPGKRICIDENECENDLRICLNGDCVNTQGSYRCDCESGYHMREGDPGCVDVDECTLTPQICHPDASCYDSIGSYDCRCLPGYVGNGKECTDVDECSINNGGCDPNAVCLNIPGSYKCQCESGFEGDGDVCTDIDECYIYPSCCTPYGRCDNYPGFYTCICDMGFSAVKDESGLSKCENINECVEFPDLCLNGRCYDKVGSFECQCDAGFTLDEKRTSCVDIDECESSENCQFGTCVNKQGSHECLCEKNYRVIDSGNACFDDRLGMCYMEYGVDTRGDPQCRLSFQGIIRRTTCCCSVGVAWGQDQGTCERCPKRGSPALHKLCPGGTGFEPVLIHHGIVIEDIKECVNIPDLCSGGKCENRRGRFNCICPHGYQLNPVTYACEDVDECSQYPGICGVGECLNKEGDYTCSCPMGHLLMPDKNCMDMRKSTCHGSWSNSTRGAVCEREFGTPLSRKICCCSVGKAWLEPGNPQTGHSEACEVCPKNGTDEYHALCGLRPGYVFEKKINHCELLPDLCQNGVCIDEEPGFSCDCRNGFIYDPNLHNCVDINECSKGVSNGCGGSSYCENVPGSYRCMCPDGYRLIGDGIDCEDIDECVESFECDHGFCRNFPGGFNCVCDPGFNVSQSRQKCLDEDECDMQANMCGNGTCKNMMGSYRCRCDRGFTLGPSGRCEDINECMTQIHLCQHASRCRNLFGDYECLCNDGYIQEPGGHSCRDIDECVELRGICDRGSCTNYPGGFRCHCPTGYRKTVNGDACVDENECELLAGVCLFGTCINREGDYTCECPSGFEMYFNRVYKCMDTREGSCYDVYNAGRCLRPMSLDMKRSECCCAMGGPAAWSFEDVCSPCPVNGTKAFARLCKMGFGYTEDRDGMKDIDECVMHPKTMCGNGKCTNMDGTFRCDCKNGYRLARGSHTICEDKNECSEGRPCGEGTCRNTDGSFECRCMAGFQVSMDKTCTDIDECLNPSINKCAFRCQNTVGSFICTCPGGFQLSADKRHCQDIDECSIPSMNDCRFACKNIVGSHLCICPQGFRKTSMQDDDCVDVNECTDLPGVCRNGRCRNTRGGYECVCNPGFTLSLVSKGHVCLDTRLDVCYTTLSPRGACLDVSFGLTSLDMEKSWSTVQKCCCSRAKAWGSSCQRCPQEGTPEFKDLCPFGVGYDPNNKDINECDFMKMACPNGQCLNNQGSYRCICNPGYDVDDSGKSCSDMDECDMDLNLCDHKCTNTIGSFICSCPGGYMLNKDGQSCTDTDECRSGTACPYRSTCINTPGSFECNCPSGHIMRNNQCIDVNECEESRGVCGPLQTCENTPGSYLCSCPPGYKLDDITGICVNTNECTSLGRPCGDAVCTDTIGAYECACPNRGEFNPSTLTCSGQVRPPGSKCTDDCNFGCGGGGGDGSGGGGGDLGGGGQCACPLGFQLLRNGHCIATISSPHEEYFKNKPLEHVPSQSGLPFGEGCWYCAVTNINQTALQSDLITNRRRRDTSAGVQGDTPNVIGIQLDRKDLVIDNYSSPILTLAPSLKNASADSVYDLVYFQGTDDPFKLSSSGTFMVLIPSKIPASSLYRFVIVSKPKKQATPQNRVLLVPIEIRLKN